MMYLVPRATLEPSWMREPRVSPWGKKRIAPRRGRTAATSTVGGAPASAPGAASAASKKAVSPPSKSSLR